MKGGALLGQGTYGCVFDPPLLCKDAKQRKIQRAARVVGKITQAIDVENEFAAAEALAVLPFSHKYFVLPDPTSYCKPAPTYQQPDKKAVQGCEAIQKYGEEGMIHFLMPYGGLSIKPFMEKEKRGKDLQAFPFFRQLLEAGALLALRGFVHYDLHLGNLLLDPKTRLPRLIDFGMAFNARQITLDTLEDRWKVYSPDYNPEPPEVTVMTGLRNNLTARKVLLEMAEKREVLGLAERILGLPRSKQLQEFGKFWTTSNAIKQKDWVAVFKLYWPAFDAWGIGYILFQLYRVIIQSKDIQAQADWTSRAGRVKEVLRGLLRLDPRQRLDCVEALQILDPGNPILESSTGKSWLDEKEKMRAALPS